MAVRLVKIDSSFTPPKDCPQALLEKGKLRIVPTSVYSDEFMLMRIYGFPLILMMGGVIYSYLMLKKKKEPLSNFQDKDYEKLTLWQLKQKEKLVIQEKQFDSILDSLQNKLKDEYQETLHEFQDFVYEQDQSKVNNG
jgi:hypothetical protein